MCFRDRCSGRTRGLAGRPWNPNLDGGNLGPGEAVERMVHEGPKVKEGMGTWGYTWDSICLNSKELLTVMKRYKIGIGLSGTLRDYMS
jgi:hypothetical protein